MNDNFFKYIFEAVPLRLPQLIDTLSDIASRIWQMGWAEANAGNVSINITQDLKDQYLIKDTDPCHYYLVSRTGSRYRQISRDPMAALVLICVADNQDSIYPIGARPTSEWNSHKALQKMFLGRQSSPRVVLHVHPDEIIAVSKSELYSDQERFCKALLDTLPEMKYYLSEGIALAPYEEAGSIELAIASADCVSNCKALIWREHGLLAFGKDLDEAFDYLEIICKAARIYFLTK